MKKIWSYLKNHVREDFSAAHYLVVAVLLIVSMIFNYKTDFDHKVLDVQTGFTKVALHFAFFAFIFYSSVLSYVLFNKKLHILAEREFWIKSVLCLALLAIDGSNLFISDTINKLLHPSLHYWAYKVVVNLTGFFIVVIPLLIFYKFYEKGQEHRYGLNAKKFDYRPYVIMLAIMAPLIVAASFDSNFLRQYPMYKPNSAAQYLGIPEWVPAGIYELAYGFDFLSVEFFFRGFLVIGLMNVLGRGAVLAMAATYCFLHFGKPYGEAISSIFGGYILGVIAYETKSIWGGVMLHIGVAWSMEIAAFVQKMVR